jgi:O-antigen/teichoic acid export membrane protein
VRSHLIALGRQSLVYGVAGAVLQLVGLITLPVYARVFTPAEYGVIELATVAFTLLIIAVDAGLGAAMQREYFEVPEENRAARMTVASTATITSVGLASAFAVPAILLREPLAGWLFDDSGQSDVIVLVALSVVAGTFAIFLREVMRVRFQPWRFAISSLIAGVVAAAVGLVWVLGYDGDESAVMAGFLAGQVASVLYGLVAVRGQVGWHFSRDRLRSLAAFGLPLVPAGAALWGMGFIDRVILGQLDGLASVGEYAVGTRFASVLMFVIGAFGTAYIPFMFSTHAEAPERERALRAGVLTYAAVVFTAIALGLALFAREIASVVAPDYDDAYTIVGVLCLGVAAFGLTPITSAGISITRQTKYVMRYTGLAVLVSAGLCFALIPPVGLTGAAIGTAAGYVVLAVLSLLRSQRLSPADFHLGRVLRVFALAGVLMPLGLLELSSEAATLALKLAGAGAFVAGLWLLGILGEVENAELRRAIAAGRRRVASGGAG